MINLYGPLFFILTIVLIGCGGGGSAAINTGSNAPDPVGSAVEDSGENAASNEGSIVPSALSPHCRERGIGWCS